jgi:steroid delta-isomerase-like uncharacterized protein
MSAQENKALVRRFLAALGAQDLTAVDDVLSSDYTLHMVGLPQPVQGLAAWKETISAYFAAFPDLEVELEDEIAEGDRVVIRYAWRGTHRGDFMGIAATGRMVRVPGTIVFRVAGDRVAEEWHLDDALGLLQQLGAVPQPHAAIATS